MPHIVAMPRGNGRWLYRERRPCEVIAAGQSRSLPDRICLEGNERGCCLGATVVVGCGYLDGMDSGRLDANAKANVNANAPVLCTAQHSTAPQYCTYIPPRSSEPTSPGARSLIDHSLDPPSADTRYRAALGSVKSFLLLLLLLRLLLAHLGRPAVLARARAAALSCISLLGRGGPMETWRVYPRAAAAQRILVRRGMTHPSLARCRFSGRWKETNKPIVSARAAPHCFAHLLSFGRTCGPPSERWRYRYLSI